ncbi:hypothetical protein [Actinoalloteichus caeruleus]
MSRNREVNASADVEGPENVAYNQPPHTSFFLGFDMETPDQPNIYYP